MTWECQECGAEGERDTKPARCRCGAHNWKQLTEGLAMRLKGEVRKLNDRLNVLHDMHYKAHHCDPNMCVAVSKFADTWNALFKLESALEGDTREYTEL